MNKYEIIGIVGEGAYGIVYKAKNKDSGEYGRCHILISCPVCHFWQKLTLFQLIYTLSEQLFGQRSFFYLT